jgi:hypothetical protein
MIDSDIYCPGCGVLLTENNVGGYRCYCETCVEKMPKFPKAPTGTGFVLQGKYPDFYWEEAVSATLLSVMQQRDKGGELYDEDIPQ